MCSKIEEPECLEKFIISYSSYNSDSEAISALISYSIRKCPVGRHGTKGSIQINTPGYLLHEEPGFDLLKRDDYHSLLTDTTEKEYYYDESLKLPSMKELAEQTSLKKTFFRGSSGRLTKTFFH